MSTHQFVKPDGTLSAVIMVGIRQLDSVTYDLALVQPPGGLGALTVGSGRLAASRSPAQADFLVEASSQSDARLQLLNLREFAADAIWLERLLVSGVTPEARLAGNGESVLGYAVAPLSPFGTDFKLTMTLVVTSPGIAWHAVADADSYGLADASGDVLLGLEV